MPTTSVGREAVKPNLAIESLAPLVGEWRTEGTHPQLQGTLHGRTSFEWIEGGAFLMMRSEVDEPGVPSGVAIFGSDDTNGRMYMLYFDERGVSRMYEASMKDNVLRFWRNAPEFNQRMTCTVREGGKVMEAVSELDEKGAGWRRDLVQTYTRI
jgi:hypothetical protein